MRKTLAFMLATCLFASSPSFARKKEVKPEIPILAWYSIPPGEYSTLEHYQELRDCGFTHSFAHNYGEESAMKILDLCAQVGLKSIFMSPGLTNEPEETVRRVRNHKGLGGYFLRDEPSDNDMKGLGEWARRIESEDTIHPCYLNLLPSHAFPNAEYYRIHLENFCSQVHLPQISFDHYPVLFDGQNTFLNGRFYENLELVSQKAREEGIPFWAFALSTAHNCYPTPPLAHLRLQMYSNLAYGAQLLQYFTYWCPGTETWDFHDAPITQDGHRTATYDIVRQMNQEIQRRAQVWLGCTVQDVAHLGNEIPQGTHTLTALPQHFSKLELVSGSALVSQIQNHGKQYVMLVNTSPTQQAQLNIIADSSTKILQRDGKKVKANVYAELQILEPGDCLIFQN